jgi:DNA mismatch repair protein MutS
MKLSDVNIKDVSPMMQQYMEIKNANKDLIIFFRLGDFYEMFFEDAVLVSKELELVLTGKTAGLEERIPMCGVPYHASENYINQLIDKGYKVGICEQLEEPGKGLVKRGLVKIVTSGTTLNIDPNSFNYVASLTNDSDSYILTYLDITTGDTFSKVIKDNIISEIESIGIKEIIYNNIDKTIIKYLKDMHIQLTEYSFKDNDLYNYVYEDIKDQRIINNTKTLLSYINEVLKVEITHLKKLIIKKKQQYLGMNIHTKRNLELTSTIRTNERIHSLLWLLDKTKTAMGSRYLKNLIEEPLIDKDIINKRYDYIENLMKDYNSLDSLKELLNEVYDIDRLTGKISSGSCNAKDLLQLKRSIKVLPEIDKIIKKTNFYQELKDVSSLYNLLEEAIYEDPPITLKDGYLIKDGYNDNLDELRSIKTGGKNFILKFEQEEKERTGIKNLKVGYNRVFGYYIEIPKGSTHLVKEEYGYERKQTLVNQERYISPILKEKEDLILSSEDKIIRLEYELFQDIRKEVITYIKDLQDISNTLSLLDVLVSFTIVSEENNYTRPKLVNNHNLTIKDSRHPVVEKVINTPYINNDIIMDENTNILLITGPNMAGKSTYMRQLAIIVIMAQIGCFVPAKEAIIPIFDSIYTRIGASDDLVSGDSTFMVEMKDANYAISSATENSLILFDELGRGTATFDGIALAQSIIEYIAKNIKAKTLFSTHYHELTDLEDDLPNLKNVHVDATYVNNELIFMHKVKEGSVDKSYGIHVAALANLDESIIERANYILSVYENKEFKRDKKLKDNPIPIKDNKLETRIKEINLNSITPMEALNILNEMKESLKDE